MGIFVGLGLPGGSEVWNWKTRKRKWQGWKRDMAREGGRVGETLNPLHSGHLSLLSLGARIIVASMTPPKQSSFMHSFPSPIY